MKNIKIEKASVEVPGGNIYVRKWSPEAMSTNAPMVLLHDSLGCVDLWRDFPGELAHRI